MNIENLQADALSDSSDNLEILFLDTFSSQSIEDRAIDDVNSKKDFSVGLIQFSSPVIIHELRIIPLSTLVSAECLKGVRLGATIPSSFDVHFYVNDLKTKEAPTFLDIGNFAYKEHDRYIFKPQIHVPTDGLFLRGYFESLTIAVLGVVTDISSLVSNKKQAEQSNSCNVSDEIKSIDEEDVHNSSLDKSIEIKEPDDVEDTDFSEHTTKAALNTNAGTNCLGSESNANNCEFNKNTDVSAVHVLKEDVHSPSPVSFTRIRSPSPHLISRSSPPKSHNSSISPKDVILRSREKNRDLYSYHKAKYSSSPSNSVSPTTYSVKSRVTSSPVKYRQHHHHHLSSSVERDREIRGSSSQHRDRYHDDEYGNYQSRHQRSRRSAERSPVASRARSSAHSNYGSGGSSRHVQSRSPSRESLYGRTQYLRSLEQRSSSRHDGRRASRSHSRERDRSRRSISPGRNHDARSIHSDSRSVCSINSRTRSSGGHYELNDSHRDLSPKSSSSSKHHYPHSSMSSRRSRSISPATRKRRYHSARPDSFSPHGDHYSSMRSPDHKKSRYSSRHHVASPRSPASFGKRSHSIRSISPSLSPKVAFKASSALESLSSPRRPQSTTKTLDGLSPFNMSPHSSLSNVSLRSLEQNNLANHDGDDHSHHHHHLTGSKDEQKNTAAAVNGNSTQLENGSVKNDVELFEPLSPTDDLLDMTEPVEDTVANSNENYEQISLSSDGDMDNDAVSELDARSKEGGSEHKAELLEVISSDEEYEDDLNAALSSDNIDYAKSYLDNAGSDKFEDDEVDSAFDINKSLFDPFVVNQLKPLSFPFNNNNSTTFIDEKLFKLIVKMIDDKFAKLYSAEVIDTQRRDMINESWVKDVEQLACEIMKLTSPINCPSFGQASTLAQCAPDLNRLTSVLIAITKDGLNFELATSQKQAFKVRHLKAGIKLFTALFSSLDLRSEDTHLKLSAQLLQANLPHDLLLLYNKPYMTLSLRLLILNGLIVLCDYPEGVEYLCNQKLNWPDVDQTEPLLPSDEAMQVDDCDPLRATDHQLTIYQYILTLILQQQKSRLTSVFEELLDKVHLFELFKVLSLANNGEANGHVLGADQNSNQATQVETMLVQLVASFSRLSNRIHRPLRLLPNICQYEIKTAVHTSTPLLLLSSPSTATDSSSNSQHASSSDLFNFIKTRFTCRHISCSSSKIGFFSQKAFYRYFQHFDSLHLFVRILTAINEHLAMPPSHDGGDSSGHHQLCEVVISLLDALTSHQPGLKFLLEDQRNADYANAIHQCLVSCKLNSCQPSALSERLIDFGVKYVTRLHTFNLIDGILHNIFTTQLEREDIENITFNPPSISSNFCKNDNFQAIEHLFRLFTMVYLDHSVFRDSVISLLTMEHNFDAIIAFLLPITSQFNSQKMTLISSENMSSLDSISFVYATKLTVSCIQYLPEKNLIHFYDSYGKMLLKSIETVQSLAQTAAVKLHKSDIYQNHILKFASLANWLSPLKTGSFNSHEELAIRMFVTILKKHNDACRDKFKSIENYVHRVFYFEPEIITAIKVLVALCDPTSDYAKNQDPDIQLKYKYSLLHCYSYDCVSYLLTLLEALQETCLRPSHQTYAYSHDDSYTNLFLKSFYKANGSMTPQKQHSLQQHSGSFAHQGPMILEFIRPSIRLLRLILNYLLSSVGSGFNDSTPVPILLRIYNFLDFYRLSVISTNRLHQVEIGARTIARSIQQEIIDILLSIYTCVFVEHSETEDALSKSVWTKMLRLVFQFTTASPKHFSSGLAILSQLLPPPFPTSQVVDFEVANLVNYRKLWSAHLHVLKADLEQMICFLLLSDCPSVLERLRAVCNMLCDLYTPTVTTVAKSLTEFLVHNLNCCLQLAWDAEQQLSLKQCTSNCIKTLNLVLHLFSRNAAFRIGILNALYLLANADGARKDSSKIYHFVGKLFECLHQKKLEHSVQLSATNLFKNLLTDTELDSASNDNREISELIPAYFDKNRHSIASSNDCGPTFKFPDKLASRFIVVSSESLNDFFSKRLSCVVTNDRPAGTESTMKIKEENIDGLVEQRVDIEIYSPEFVRLFATGNGALHLHTAPDNPNGNSEEAERMQFTINFAEFGKKYFEKDTNCLSKTLEVLYTPIVEPPEPQAEKPSEEMSKLNSAPPNNKRLPNRGRGRNPFGGRLNDPFRSRPPNTSRPPSMHVDDFVALEQRQDPLAGKNRSSHTALHLNSGSSNSSSYGGGNKHQDYHHMRKKNLPSHHAVHGHSHLGPYSSNSSASNTAHYKQP